MIDLEEALRPLIATAPHPPAIKPRHRRRRWAYAAAAAVFVVAAGAGVVAYMSDDNGSEQLEAVTGTTVDDAPSVVAGPIDGSPLGDRNAEFVGAYGDRIVLFGGSDAADVPQSDGAIFDPTAETWALIPTGPVVGSAAMHDDTGVLYVVSATDSAAFVFGEDRWYGLGRVPFAPGATSSPDVLVIENGVLALQWSPRPEAALLDTTTGEWHAITAPPLGPRYGARLVWTGTEVLVWGGQRNDNSPWLDGASYSVAEAQWRPMPDAPFGGHTVPYFNGLYRPTATWTGDEMIVWGWDHQSLGSVTLGAAYDPATATWRTIAPAPIEARDSCECAGGEAAAAGPYGDVFVWTGNLDRRGSFLLRYDPAEDQWSRVGDVRPDDSFSNAVAVVGNEVFVIGPNLRIPFTTTD